MPKPIEQTWLQIVYARKDALTRHGKLRNDPKMWARVLVEEANEAALECLVEKPDVAALKTELAQVAQLAIGMLQVLNGEETE